MLLSSGNLGIRQAVGRTVVELVGEGGGLFIIEVEAQIPWKPFTSQSSPSEPMRPKAGGKNNSNTPVSVDKAFFLACDQVHHHA